MQQFGTEEIAQFETFAKLILRIGRDLSGELQMSPAEYQSIFIISYSQNANQKTICDTCSIDKSSISRVIDKLCKGGIVNKKQSETDRRNDVLSLTQKGVQLAQKVSAAFINVVGKYFNMPCNEDKAVFFGILNKYITKTI